MSAFALWLVAPTSSSAASSPFGIATPDSPVGNGLSGPLAPFLLYAIHLQTLFYQKLTSILGASYSNHGAGIWLIGLSFLYGIFHAIGPGHGKAVMSSYVLATGDRLVQTTAMSVAASFIQALSAISIVFVATMIFDATATEMTLVTDRIELLSYGLIALLGLTLALSRVRALAEALRRKPDGRSAFSCDGYPAGVLAPPELRVTALENLHHGVNCGCVTVSRMAVEKPEATIKERLHAVASIGIRPCSGALIVLVFALSQHLAFEGILSVLAMAAGTALTVSVVAALSVLARGFLARLVSSDHWMKPRLAIGFQFVAACAVFLFGITMMTGLMAADGFL
jgi:ABC-type nickel/cobalt efflux system permease component RcnA